MKFLKPKFWDYKKPNLLSHLLLPLTFPLVINNFFLNHKNNNINHSKIKKICIGNIYVGGTGKTPLVMEIYRILNQLDFKTAVIKKFYTNHGDEQKILHKNTKLYCLKDRVLSLNEAIKDGNDIAIFDDGLQDRSINYDLNFVCFNNIKFIGNSLLIPAGPLREKIESISKYDAIFLNGNQNDNTKLKLEIEKYNKNILIFESFYKPTNINLFNINEKYLIFSGIGNPDGFKETLIKNNFNIVKEIIFPDHHIYDQSDIDKIRFHAKNFNAKIITTEKDYIKINTKDSLGINFLKIDIIIKNENELVEFIKSKI